MDHPENPARPIRRILRIITRMNIGGPSLHVYLLAKHLDGAAFQTHVLTGCPEPGEGDLSRLLDESGVSWNRVELLRRPIDPPADFRALAHILRICRR